jgi:molybdate transport system substrate-binding protein
MKRLVIVLIVLAACGKKADTGKGGDAAGIKVAAASDLAFAFKEIGETFEKQTGKTVTFTFGSSGNLAKQIAQGAPYDVFAAANVAFIDEVVKADACDGATKAMYARGRIVVWTKKGSSVAAPAALADLKDARFAKIAIANPEHAPYGKAAKQALEKLGIWDAVQPRIVFGENIQQTLQFAQTGNADAAIAALSLALANKEGDYVLVDDALHAPLDQALAACKHGASFEIGRQFAAFVKSDAGHAIMKRYGFLLPGEALAKTQ